MIFEKNEIQILESEKNNSESNLSVNPWDVLNASDFLKYCCPECDFKSGELFGFSQHAIINHVLSNTLFTDRNSLIDCDIENDKNPDLNSNEAKLELEDDILFDTKPARFESDIDTFVEHEETIESEMNIEINSNEKKPRKKSLNLDASRSHFPEATVNLENQTDENEKKLEKKVTLKSFESILKISMKDLDHSNICEICGFTSTTLQGLKSHVNMTHSITIDGIAEKKDKNTIGKDNLLEMDSSENKDENSDEKVINNQENEKVQNLDKSDLLCAKCGQHFTSLIDLVHHFFKEHKKLGEDFDCPKCPKIISTMYRGSKHYVMEHIRNTHLKETKKCPDCKQILKLSCFKKHRQFFHGICAKKKDTNAITTIAPNPDDGYECPDCKKILSTKGSKYTLLLVILVLLLHKF